MSVRWLARDSVDCRNAWQPYLKPSRPWGVVKLTHPAWNSMMNSYRITKRELAANSSPWIWKTWINLSWSTLAMNKSCLLSLFGSKRCLEWLHLLLWHRHTQLEKPKVLSYQSSMLPLSMGVSLIGEAFGNNLPSPCTIAQAYLIWRSLSTCSRVAQRRVRSKDSFVQGTTTRKLSSASKHSTTAPDWFTKLMWRPFWM